MSMLVPRLVQRYLKFVTSRGKQISYVRLVDILQEKWYVLNKWGHKKK